jgi:Fe-Mn family superoxide dismutase
MLQRVLGPLSSLRNASLLISKKTPFPLPQKRNIHRVPQLAHDAYFKKNGVPDLLSPAAFDFAWTQYQALLVDKLNLLTQDTVDADAKPGELLAKYSRRREMASLFNYASMAHNNHFFFNCLSPIRTEIPEWFAVTIADSGSSIESMKLDFLATANAMFGPGFVWLCKNLDRRGLVNMFCTYNAGSPYPTAYSRRQSVDMATHEPGPHRHNDYAGFMGEFSRNQKIMAPGAIDIQPILCVNTWEHVWLMDYGIGGKEDYLERWWDSINWEVVVDNYNAVPVRNQTQPQANLHQSISVL